MNRPYHLGPRIAAAQSHSGSEAVIISCQSTVYGHDGVECDNQSSSYRKESHGWRVDSVSRRHTAVHDRSCKLVYMGISGMAKVGLSFERVEDGWTPTLGVTSATVYGVEGRAIRP